MLGKEYSQNEIIIGLISIISIYYFSQSINISLFQMLMIIITCGSIYIISINKQKEINNLQSDNNISETNNKKLLKFLDSISYFNMYNPTIYSKFITKIKNYINNDYPIINISNSSPCIGYLTKLIEDAESVHLIENNNVNFIYHMQYKNLLKYENHIYFHVWLRDRNWLWAKDYNFDSAWKMMINPKLKNWNFIFNESDANCILNEK